jgi:hypothetical protein
VHLHIAARDVHPGLLSVPLDLCKLWLTMVEGSRDHWSVLLPSTESFSQSLTRSRMYKSMWKLLHKGDNLDRYLRRQFMAAVMVFTH